MDSPDTKPLIEELNATYRDGFVAAMGLEFLTATPTLVEMQWTVAKHHLQPYGIVHGGVHSGVIETVCSVGAALAATERGQLGGVVGLENHTSFLRAVREGTKLLARGTPITRGRTTQVWQAEIRDEAGQLIARGTVRLLSTPELGPKNT